MRKLTAATLIILAFVVGVLSVVPTEAQRANGIYILDGTRAWQPAWSVKRNTFAAQNATGQTTGFLASTFNHAIELIVTGSPSTCTYRLQGSIDNSTWFNISASDITCTSTTVAYEVDKPVVYVRGNLATLSGGTAPTVTLKYAGR